jgi:hypothetical protein
LVGGVRDGGAFHGVNGLVAPEEVV